MMRVNVLLNLLYFSVLHKLQYDNFNLLLVKYVIIISIFEIIIILQVFFYYA